MMTPFQEQTLLELRNLLEELAIILKDTNELILKKKKRRRWIMEVGVLCAWWSTIVFLCLYY